MEKTHSISSWNSEILMFLLLTPKFFFFFVFFKFPDSSREIRQSCSSRISVTRLRWSDEIGLVDEMRRELRIISLREGWRKRVSGWTGIGPWWYWIQNKFIENVSFILTHSFALLKRVSAYRAYSWLLDVYADCLEIPYFL